MNGSSHKNTDQISPVGIRSNFRVSLHSNDHLANLSGSNK
ncbi:hypothetical protein D924_01758 [Enterococcus faecalis 06-MB-S-10]|nr:hypothetical protein D924_01758 [Enterococcus faecalis 06-MB-S-10]